jgi:hypothetical protein
MGILLWGTEDTDDKLSVSCKGMEEDQHSLDFIFFVRHLHYTPPQRR